MNMSEFYVGTRRPQVERSTLHRDSTLTTLQFAHSARILASYIRPGPQFQSKKPSEKSAARRNCRTWASPLPINLHPDHAFKSLKVTPITDRRRERHQAHPSRSRAPRPNQPNPKPPEADQRPIGRQDGSEHPGDQRASEAT